MDTNVKAVFFLTRELVPALEQAAKLSSHASIINVGSVNGIKTDSLPTFSYDASKAAVHHLGRHLASVLASKNITCNNLAPGLVPSKMSNQLKVRWQKEKKKKKKKGGGVGSFSLGSRCIQQMRNW
jgi:NAD(P)-dependent dehydrogenase (short-subunit alcohol dehydrogenase family)